MSALEYNGSALICMVGKECVGIAADRRFGVQQQTVSTNMKRIYSVHDKLFMGLSGLATDVHTLAAKLKASTELYKLRENRDIKPSAFTNMLCSTLYQKRFGPYFIEPLVAGLEPTYHAGPAIEEGEEQDEDEAPIDYKKKVTWTPFISGTDLIGAPVFTEDFCVCGTAEESLFGTCESMFRKDMEPEDLFETLSQCLLSAVDRNCVSGWGGVVYIITPDKIIKRELDARVD
eukprot:g1663.t1